MIFKLSIDDRENKESTKPMSWFFDYNIPYHIKKDYERKFVRKQDYYCPLICYGLDSNKEEVIKSNQILIPKTGSVRLKLFMDNIYHYNIKYFKFKYLDKEEIYKPKILSGNFRFVINL